MALALRKMNSEITTDEVFAYHQATGCTLMDARRVLGEMAPLLRARVLESARTQSSRSEPLHDPLEDDPALRPIIERAAIEAERIVRSRGPLRMGSCHSIGREQARILSEKHQLAWFSPQQMNPYACFD
jgi:hypothetical protein